MKLLFELLEIDGELVDHDYLNDDKDGNKSKISIARVLRQTYIRNSNGDKGSAGKEIGRTKLQWVRIN